MSAAGLNPVLLGCDFSSAPTLRKPIVIALGTLVQGQVRVEKLLRQESLDAFQDWLSQPLQLVGGFDLPFGRPRELVLALGCLPFLRG